MKDQLLSPDAWRWFLILITGLVAFAWLIYDTINLIRARHLDRSVAANRDKHFGYVMGIVIGIVGVIGTLRYQGVV